MFENIDIKLLIVLTIVTILGFGYSHYLPKEIPIGVNEYRQSNLPNNVDMITIFLLFVILVSYLVINRKKQPVIVLTLRTLGSILPIAFLIGVSLLVLYRFQFIATKGGTIGVERIQILGQTLPTDGTAGWLIFFFLILAIFYLNLKDYFTAINEKISLNFLKSFIKGAVLSLFFGIIVGFVITYGRYGETAIAGPFILMSYLIGGSVLTAITSSIAYFKSKRKIMH